jgi:hypothetical protein
MRTQWEYQHVWGSNEQELILLIQNGHEDGWEIAAGLGSKSVLMRRRAGEKRTHREDSGSTGS